MTNKMWVLFKKTPAATGQELGFMRQPTDYKHCMTIVQTC